MRVTIALIGHPVAHSISPRFQQAAFDALGIDAVYEAWDVPPADLRGAVERLRAGAVLGANITVPHKVELLRLVDRPDALAERVGAVNTVVHRDGLLHATNTDVTGIRRALEDVGAPLAGAQVVLIGAGGAARAAVVAMRQAGVRRLTVANRSPERAEALRDVAGADLDFHTTLLDAADDAFRRALRTAQVVIQATPAGMRHGTIEDITPIPAELFHPGQLAFDLVYVPEQTPFLQAAREAEARPLGGLAMLVHQGAESFRLWTGAEPPLDIMFAAARDALDESHRGNETGEHAAGDRPR